MPKSIYLGVDLGGTKIAVAVVSARGEVLGEQRVKTPGREGPEAVIDALCEAVRQAAESAGVGLKNITAGGVGAPGPIDVRAGRVVAPPNLPGWTDVALGELLQERLGFPIRLENDANVAGLAEHRFGAGRGCSPLVYLTVSTGIGGALLVQGKLYAGATGAAGEFGHMILLPDGPLCGCGGRGCLEALASGTAIANRAQEIVRRGVASLLTERYAKRPNRITAEIVSSFAEAGDVEAKRILDHAMASLGMGVAGLVNALNPQRVVIGGGLSGLGPRLFEPVRRAVARHANPVAAGAVTIVPAELGDRVGVLGAAALAMGK